MTKRAPSLRNTLAAITAVLASLALLAAAALVLLTTYLHRASKAIGASVESVRLAEEARTLLLVHARASEPVVSRGIEDDLETALFSAERYVTTPREEAILGEARARVASYFAVARRAESSDRARTESLAPAFSALADLIDVNVEQSRVEQARAARWDRMANILGGGAVLLVLSLTAASLYWLVSAAFRPVLALAPVMERFARGDREARAVETGPAEVRQMAWSFNEMASALAEQREAQIAFLAGVAHDLRTPLAALEMSVAMIEPDKPLPPEPRVRRALQIMGRQLVSLGRMVGDLLDLATIEAGTLELRYQYRDARDLVRNVVELFESTSQRHRVELTIPEHAVPLRCDPLRVEQVMTNLVSNAIKYSPSGGSVDVSVARACDDVVFTVADHGVGMSEEDQRRVFDPFFRVGSSKDSARGTGLGLFVVQRIVDAHGGRVEVESARGRGSTLRVSLPSGEVAQDRSQLTTSAKTNET